MVKIHNKLILLDAARSELKRSYNKELRIAIKELEDDIEITRLKHIIKTPPSNHKNYFIWAKDLPHTEKRISMLEKRINTLEKTDR